MDAADFRSAVIDDPREGDIERVLWNDDDQQNGRDGQQQAVDGGAKVNAPAKHDLISIHDP